MWIVINSMNKVNDCLQHVGVKYFKHKSYKEKKKIYSPASDIVRALIEDCYDE